VGDTRPRPSEPSIEQVFNGHQFVDSCLAEGCTSHTKYGSEEDMLARCCAKHRRPGDVNVCLDRSHKGGERQLHRKLELRRKNMAADPTYAKRHKLPKKHM
jgi:hypothetical protein